MNSSAGDEQQTKINIWVCLKISRNQNPTRFSQISIKSQMYNELIITK